MARIGVDRVSEPGAAQAVIARGAAGYRAEIDGLRAVAVLPVILFHAGFQLFSGGYVGVDVFFVISGYLITGILLKEVAEGRFSLVGFYERRARRILPALFFVMICCVPFAWFWMVPTQFREFGQSLVATSLFASNVLFWRQSGYFDGPAEERPLLHTWSLAVEEQFYLGFPLFFLLMMRFGRNPTFWSIVAVAAVSLVLSEYASRYHPRMNFYLAPTRAWELLAGSLCAFILYQREQKPNDLLAWLGLGLILFAIVQFDHDTPFPSLHTLLPVLGTVLIILFASGRYGAGALLSTPVFVGIGLISYSAYLWHQPLFAFARVRSLDAPEGWLMMTLAGASLALAYLSWRFVEQPFRRRGRASWVGRPVLFAGAALVSAAFIAFGGYAHVKQGLADRFQVTELQRTYLRTAVPSPMRSQCHRFEPPYIKPENACTYFGEAATAAVVGDSHVVELAYALGQALEPEGVAVKHLSYGACSPQFGQGNDTHCARWNHDAVEYLIGNHEIETVVVIYRIHSHLFGGHEGVYPDLPDARPRDFRRAALASYQKVVATLAEHGKQVVLVLQSPELARPMEDLIFRFGSSEEPIVGVPRRWWDDRGAYLRERLEVPESVIVVDPAEVFCDADYCYAGRDGVSYYYDDDHMSVAGAHLVVEQILGALADRAPE